MKLLKTWSLLLFILACSSNESSKRKVAQADQQAPESTLKIGSSKEMEDLFDPYQYQDYFEKNQVWFSRKGKGYSTLPLIFMADNQINNLFTAPNLFRSGYADNIHPAAVRPPGLDLFSIDLMEWSLNKYGKGNFIIHLGDAINIGCKNEWNQFLKFINPMRGKKKIHRGWVMAPGNHDFFFYGNSNGSRIFRRKGLGNWWKKSCHQEYVSDYSKAVKNDQTLKKKAFILSYLKELEKQRAYNPKDFSFRMKDAICQKNLPVRKTSIWEPATKMQVCTWKSRKGGFLSKLIWGVPESDLDKLAYKSFIVQELNLATGIKGIVLDTTDYFVAPTASGWGKSVNAGSTGSISEYQTRIINSILEKDKYYFFMGHHQYKEWDDKSKGLFEQMVQRVPGSILVSAHTHWAFNKKHELFWEINIGSLTDWVAEFAQFRINRGKDFLNVFPSRKAFSVSEFSKHACSGIDDHSTGKFGYLQYKSGAKGPKAVREKTYNLLLYYYKEMFKRLFSKETTRDKIFDKIPVEKTPFASLFQKSKLRKEAFEYVKKIEKSGDIECKSFPNPEFCLKTKHDLLLKIFRWDKDHYADKDYYKERVLYGSCQSIWASKAEWFSKGRYMKNDKWVLENLSN